MSRKRSNSPRPPEPQAQEGVGPELEPQPEAEVISPEPAEETTAPDPEPSEEVTATARFRVNWHFTGFRPCELQEGDVIEATEAEAAPYLGRVLTRIETQE